MGLPQVTEHSVFVAGELHRKLTGGWRRRLSLEHFRLIAPFSPPRPIPCALPARPQP